MSKDIKSSLRFLGILLVAEGALMALCLIPAIHFADGTLRPMALCSAFTLSVGTLLWVSFASFRAITDARMSYLIVVLTWVILVLFATLPFLASVGIGFSYAWFEAMSGLTSTGATVFPVVESLPASILLWRSISQWFGGFGIVLLVLALTPRLGINKYALYTAEASAADNSGSASPSTSVTVRRTLGVYLFLTALFITLLLITGMEPFDAVNLTFTNISSGGFSVRSDSIAAFSPAQQYILTAAMFLAGVNFTLLFLVFTFRWSSIRHKLEQFRLYLFLGLAASLFVILFLHCSAGRQWEESFRIGLVQTVSALSTTGSVVDDTTLWPLPVSFLLLVLSLCGGMAGGTTGGIKIMRVIILRRNVKNILLSRLHPNAVNPVRLNHRPVSNHIINNVLVIFIVYGMTLLIGTMGLMLCGVDATQAVGAAVGCLTSYGPGLGPSGGFGSYAAFPQPALWLSSFLMLLGRLECMTVLILFLPRFWRR